MSGLSLAGKRVYGFGPPGHCYKGFKIDLRFGAKIRLDYSVSSTNFHKAAVTLRSGGLYDAYVVLRSDGERSIYCEGSSRPSDPSAAKCRLKDNIGIRENL